MWQIDRQSNVSIYDQLVLQLERWIAGGIYPPGALLPSVRLLSQQLGVNPNTLQKAYAELERRGYCFSVHGSGRFVSPDAAAALNAARQEKLEKFYAYVHALKGSGISADALHAGIDQVFLGI
ncbi:MAG: GntR family transcriptional regulator [Clostridia bacterium]|nr:GntR family transcriptional regulator [Clostridia bacterium]